MFVWKDECGESENVRVVWCDLSVWEIPGQKKERLREMYARTVEREHGDEKTNVIGKMPSRELDRRECSRIWELKQSVGVKYMYFVISIKSISNLVCLSADPLTVLFHSNVIPSKLLCESRDTRIESSRQARRSENQMITEYTVSVVSRKIYNQINRWNERWNSISRDEITTDKTSKQRNACNNNN